MHSNENNDCPVKQKICGLGWYWDDKVNLWRKRGEVNCYFDRGSVLLHEYNKLYDTYCHETFERR